MDAIIECCEKRLPLGRIAPLSDLELGKTRERSRAIGCKRNTCRFIARLCCRRLQLAGSALAAAQGFARMTGGPRRVMRVMFAVMEVVLMRRGGGFMRGGVTRAWQGARKQDACKIKDRQL